MSSINGFSIPPDQPDPFNLQQNPQFTSLSQASQEVWESWVPLGVFTSAIGKARNNLKHQLQDNTATDHKKAREAYQAFADRAQSTTDYYNRIALQAQIEIDYYNAEVDEKAAIADYNSSADAARTPLNNAITTYNSSIASYIAACNTHTNAAIALSTQSQTFINAAASYFNVSIPNLNPPSAANAGFYSAIGLTFVSLTNAKSQLDNARSALSQATPGTAAYVTAAANYQSAATAFRTAAQNFQSAITTYNTVQTPSAGNFSAYALATTNFNTAYNNYSTANTTYQTAYTTFTTAKNNYNSAVTAMNTAITTFNNALSTAQATYNSATDTYNSIINAYSYEAIQTERTALGMPLLSFPPIPPTPNTPTLAVSDPPVALTSVTSGQLTMNTINPGTPPMTVSQAISTYYPAIAASLINSQTFDQLKLQLLGALLDFQSNNTVGDPTLPNAFIKKIPAMFFDATSGGVTAVSNSVASVTLSTGLSSKALSRSISNAIYISYLAQAKTPIPKPLQEKIEVFVLDLVNQLANSAAQSGNLRENLFQKTPESVNGIDRALAFSEITKDVLSSDLVDQTLNRLLLTDQDPSLSLLQKQDIVPALAAAIKFELSQVALANLALALGTPGLTGQVQGNISGAPSAVALSSTTQPDATLSDPVKQVVLKSNLANYLVNAGLPVDLASQVAIHALNGIFATGIFSNVSDFAAALKDSLAQQQVDNQTINSVTSQLTADVEREVALPFLDQQLNPAIIAAAVSGSTDQFPVGSPNRIAFNQVQEALSNPQAAAAVNEVLAQPPQTIREFDQQLIGKLSNSGFSSEQAHSISSTFVGLLTPTPSENPLLTSAPQQQLKSPELVDQLTSHVVDKLTPEIGVFAARQHADQINRTVLDHLNQSNEFLRVVQESGSKESVDTLYQSLPQTSVPTVALFALHNDIDQKIVEAVPNYENPIAQDNVRTADTNKLPPNFKKNIDVSV